MSKEIFYEKTRQKIFFPKYVFSSFFLCSPSDESYKTNQIFLRKTNFSEFFFLQNTYLPFYLQSSVPPLITMSFEKNSWKTVFKRSIYSEKTVFFQNSCVTPLVSFTEPFQKNFMNVIFYDEKKCSEECFFFIQPWHFVLPLRTMLSKTFS